MTAHDCGRGDVISGAATAFAAGSNAAVPVADHLLNLGRVHDRSPGDAPSPNFDTSQNVLDKLQSIDKFDYRGNMEFL
jgi:hypothetical protein